MSGFKNFVVVGTGNVGSIIADHFLDLKAKGSVNRVLVFTRTASQPATTEKYAAKGAEVVGLEYDDRAALAKALAGVDVVISTVNPAAFAAQVTIAEVAKAAGVKLFLPSEFGNPTVGAKGLLAGKGDLHQKFKDIGLPTTLVFTGPFADFAWAPFIGLDIKSGKVSVGGDGNAPITFSSIPDTARFLGYILTSLPAEKLTNLPIIRLEGERKSFNQIFQEYEAKTGKKLEVTYISDADLEARLKANPYDFAAFLHLSWAHGEGLVGTPDNGLYPDWNPNPVITYTSAL
ncbi:NAD-P-binding protein [Auriscalpium vulgare]|uniref:NAD-P-binding protein n=1 Tax=Auriscalpium vulgare TaxID=40419 RepID=A0ACB8R8Y5_9AGAM|nr:NAD-P-binding protein [Auriscalpium vulgare]